MTQDTLFKEPYVDIDEWRDVPVPVCLDFGSFFAVQRTVTGRGTRVGITELW